MPTRDFARPTRDFARPTRDFAISRKMCVGRPEKRAPPGRPGGLGLTFRQHVRLTKSKKFFFLEKIFSRKEIFFEKKYRRRGRGRHPGSRGPDRRFHDDGRHPRAWAETSRAPPADQAERARARASCGRKPLGRGSGRAGPCAPASPFWRALCTSRASRLCSVGWPRCTPVDIGSPL